MSRREESLSDSSFVRRQVYAKVGEGGAITIESNGVLVGSYTTINFIGMTVAEEPLDALIVNVTGGGSSSGLSAAPNIVSVDTTIAADTAAYVPDYLEIADGITLDVASGGLLEIG